MFGTVSERRRVAVASVGVHLALVACGGGDDLGPKVSESKTSPAAIAYMESALNIMQSASINRLKIVWPAFRADALARIEGAVTTGDTYVGLRATLVALGDRHSFFTPPGAGAVVAMTGGHAAAPSSLAAAMAIDPTGRALGGGIVYVSIPSFSGAAAPATAFADQLQDIVKALDAGKPCGWIVDLRDNPGGNMWPMIAGIGPVLGEGELGAFVGPDSARQIWFYRDGASGVRLSDGRESISQRISGATYRLTRPNPPVAVIYGPRTASSGEAVAVAFRGRPLSRSFGRETAGLSTANAGFRLSDGGMIWLTTSADADRTGRIYGDVLSPDDPVSWNVIDPSSVSDQAAQAAIAWLKTQAACTS